ncbi:hypothetical protein BGLA2_490060 [Burkholderia gladioli]|nr:hypothetical protein BGLA2_490060 [Burkholderia gladioli]
MSFKSPLSPGFIMWVRVEAGLVAPRLRGEAIASADGSEHSASGPRHREARRRRLGRCPAPFRNHRISA